MMESAHEQTLIDKLTNQISDIPKQKKEIADRTEEEIQKLRMKLDA